MMKGEATWQSWLTSGLFRGFDNAALLNGKGKAERISSVASGLVLPSLGMVLQLQVTTSTPTERD
jgi:hypothetical protein